MNTVLYIDSDSKFIKILKSVLKNKFVLETCDDSRNIQSAIFHTNPDVILYDPYTISYNDPFNILSYLHHCTIVPTIIVFTEKNDIECVVQEMRKGAYDYIVKSSPLQKIERAIDRAILIQNQKYSFHNTVENEKNEIIGNSKSTRNLLQFISQIADSDAPVILFGETGTGKDIAAREIHAQSTRSKAPFISINCAAIPDTLFESEMFGTERGAYTGAVQKSGFIERARNGILFLDEIGELSLSSQAKLLHVIENKSIQRIGGTTSIPINVRIIAATNRDLAEMITQEKFREDLYYRICVLAYRIEPLRKRCEDIPIICGHILRSISSEKRSFTTDAMEKLFTYQWPGNIRQLRNCIWRAATLSKNTNITATDIMMW